MEPAVSPSPAARRARRGGDDQLDGDRFRDLFADDDEKSGRGQIRCPRCAWTPRSEDLWLCSCGTAWNTFETGGRCPGCGRRWTQTQCLSCGAWSPHDAWYAEQPDA